MKTSGKIFRVSQCRSQESLNIRFANEMSGRVKIFLTPVSGGRSVVLSDAVYPAGESVLNIRPADKGYFFSPGIYLLSIETAASRQFRKVIKISK